MSLWPKGFSAIVVVVSLNCHLARAQEHLYQDDDLLCRPGWSSEMYYERIQVHDYQQRASYAENQRAMAWQAIVEQRTQERIKIAQCRAAKEARRREELIAKRKAETVTNLVTNPASKQSVNRTSLTNP